MPDKPSLFQKPKIERRKLKLVPDVPAIGILSGDKRAGRMAYWKQDTIELQKDPKVRGLLNIKHVMKQRRGEILVVRADGAAIIVCKQTDDPNCPRHENGLMRVLEAKTWSTRNT